ncbi:MAG: META domain-containing protein [Paracoccaceae bacterium]
MRPILRTLSGTAAALTALAANAALEAGEWQIASARRYGHVGRGGSSSLPTAPFSGSTGCNRFQGSGVVDGGALVIDSPPVTTLMACPDAALTAQDDRIVALFAGRASLAFDPFADRVTLTRSDTTLTLVPAGTAAAEPPGPADPLPPDPILPDPSLPGPLSLADAPFVTVFGVSDRLNIHAAPGTASEVVAKAPSGTLFRNKGCQTGEAHDWCNIVSLDASGTEGWAAADYLEPAAAATRAGAGVFDRIGSLACTDGGAATKCDAGVAYDPDGTTVVAVFRPDGVQRLFTFVDGSFAFADTSQAGGGFDATATRAEDVTSVSIEGERYDIPDDLVSGQ